MSYQKLSKTSLSSRSTGAYAHANTNAIVNVYQWERICMKFGYCILYTVPKWLIILWTLFNIIDYLDTILKIAHQNWYCAIYVHSTIQNGRVPVFIDRLVSGKYGSKIKEREFIVNCNLAVVFDDSPCAFHNFIATIIMYRCNMQGVTQYYWQLNCTIKIDGLGFA